jgi:hypothetical protein
MKYSEVRKTGKKIELKQDDFQESYTIAQNRSSIQKLS